MGDPVWSPIGDYFYIFLIIVFAEQPVGRLALKPPPAERVGLVVITGGADTPHPSQCAHWDTFPSRGRLSVGVLHFAGGHYLAAEARLSPAPV